MRVGRLMNLLMLDFWQVAKSWLGGVFISIWFLRVYYSEYLNVIKHFFSLTQ